MSEADMIMRRRVGYGVGDIQTLSVTRSGWSPEDLDRLWTTGMNQVPRQQADAMRVAAARAEQSGHVFPAAAKANLEKWDVYTKNFALKTAMSPQEYEAYRSKGKTAFSSLLDKAKDIPFVGGLLSKFGGGSSEPETGFTPQQAVQGSNTIYYVLGAVVLGGIGYYATRKPSVKGRG